MQTWRYGAVATPRSSLLFLGLSLCGLLAGCGGAGGRGEASPISEVEAGCRQIPPEVVLDIAYHRVQGVDQNLLNLDLAVPERTGCQPLPVVVWVHGGSFARGDKRGPLSARKAELFNAAGMIFVAINYRLSPYPPDIDDPDRVLFPTHPQDVARALDWVARNITTYGGDPANIAVLGHSAGAHLVALVSTDQSFLADLGQPLTLLRCVAPLDTGAFDIPEQMKTGSEGIKLQKINAFGSDPAIWAQASPINHVSSGKGIPPMLFVTRDVAQTKMQLQAFIAELDKARIAHRTIDAPTITHEEVNALIGAPGDAIMTPPLMSFLDACFSKSL